LYLKAKSNFGRTCLQACNQKFFANYHMELAMSHRKTILTTAAKLTSGDRNRAYGEPFWNMSNIAELWQAYLSVKTRGKTIGTGKLEYMISPEDVAHMNVLMKIARTASPAFREDNYVDAAAYIAIAGEVRAIDEPERPTTLAAVLEQS
jgi:hypothetical protein